ncbi:MAG: hypothetical protein AAB436_02390 [Patescibacteria group bacterium]
MPSYESLVIVGPPKSGMSTIVNGLRGAEFADSLVIPRLYIAREHNDGVDDPVEVEPLSHDDFALCTRSELIDPTWHRELESGILEHRGFGALNDDESRLSVYAADSAFLIDTTNPDIRRIMANSLLILVTASEEVRQRRMLEAAPDIEELELEEQMCEDSRFYIEMLRTAREVIDTTELSDYQGQLILQRTVNRVLDKRINRGPEGYNRATE